MRLIIQRLLIAILFVCSSAVFAQDTVRENVNYRWQKATLNSDEKSSGKYYYIGLQANQLLRQLLGSAGGGDNPFTLTYSFNSVSTGHGMSFGLGFSTRTIDDEDKAINLKRSTKTQNLAIRVGYERKKSIGKRWIAGVGVDLFYDGGNSETTTSFSGQPDVIITSKTNGFGLGPRLSLLFNVSEKIYLGTETTLVFKSVKTAFKPGDPSLPNRTENVQRDRSLELGVPSSLFLVVRF